MKEGWHYAIAPVATLACASLASVGVSAQPAAGQPVPRGEVAAEMLLAVRLNGVGQIDDVAVSQLKDGSIAVPNSALLSWGIATPPGRSDEDLTGLFELPGVKWNIETSSQTLVVEVPPSAFSRSNVSLAKQEDSVPVLTSTGGFVNYDVEHDESGPARTTSGFVEVGGFSTWGHGSQTNLIRNSSNFSTLPTYTRLETNWIVDLPDRLESVKMGDTISSSGAWGNAVRLGGLQWQSNFATQPGFISFAMPSIQGEASLPSTLDLYVNDARRAQARVGAGPFEVNQLPVVTGRGEVRMVVKDLLGREQLVTRSYYVSPQLLKPDLTAFSYEAGFVRRNYGLKSADYGQAAFSTTQRTGVTPTFTREWRAELQKDQQTVGGGATVAVGDQGTADGFTSVSHSDAGMGWSVGGGVQRQDRYFSSSAQVRYSSDTYTQLGQLPTATPKLLFSVGAGAPLFGGNFGVNAVRQSYWNVLAGSPTATTILSASFGFNVGTLGYFGIFVTRSKSDGLPASAGGRPNNTIGINFVRSLDMFSNMSANQVRSSGGTVQTQVQVQRNAPIGEGFGYQINTGLDQPGGGQNTKSAAAQGVWNTEIATLTGGVGRTSATGGVTTNSVRVGASGGLALTDRGVFATRLIEGSFAVVKVADYEGVKILRDNQPVAKTNDRGVALVSGLRGFENNRISIDDNDLPLDAQVRRLDVSFVPALRSGTSITFPVQRVTSLTLQMKDAKGKDLPAGTLIKINAAETSYPIAFDGLVFIETSLSESDGPIALRAYQPYNNQFVCEAKVTLPVSAKQAVVCKEN